MLPDLEEYIGNIVLCVTGIPLDDGNRLEYKEMKCVRVGWLCRGGMETKFGIVTTGEEPGRLLEHFLPLSSFALNHRRLSTVLFLVFCFIFLREKTNEMK
jgi:hypothetical protein